MKVKSLFLVALFAVLGTTVRADEGMWLLPLLEKMNKGRMTELGFEITPKEIFDLNNTSLKDAITIFGNGCTGELVSAQGLLFTNHHCGYSSIQALSSVEHNYLKDGYWAMSFEEELPVEGLAVRALESFTDVTKKVEKAIKKAQTTQERDSILLVLQDQMREKANCDGTYVEGNLTSFYGGNTYYFIVYKVFRDIRFVGAPPSSIGKFGADTDNWVWPRHTGDFSVFRVYAGKDNEPAAYSEDNVPYTPKRFLKISLAGYQPNDPTMVIGYPGRTNRFMTAREVQESVKGYEIAIKMRGIRQEVLMADMQSDPAIFVQYANKYAGSSNGWKKWTGMIETFERLNVYERRAQQEKEFAAWVAEGGKKREARYGKAIAQIEEAIDGREDASMLMKAISESVIQIELFVFSNTAKSFKEIFEMEDAQERNEAFEKILKFYEEKIYKDYNADTDKKVAVAMINALKESIAAEDLPAFYKEIDEDFGGDVQAFVDDVFAKSYFTSLEKIRAAIEASDKGIVEDRAHKVFSTVLDVYFPAAEIESSYAELFAQGKKDYIAGTLEMREGEAIYPDANFTTRLTYGTVQPYSPRDAVYYDYYTTLDGVMEKEDPNNWEFEVPARLKELWEAKDFGQYALEDGRLPVAFISNNDITGGNSGSPIMNGRGELIGLAFDGNWDAMSGDVIFEPTYQRCINVDIRYVLFIIDKFGGAGYLLDEMEIVR